MSSATSHRRPTPPSMSGMSGADERRAGWAMGWTAFAGVMMVLNGAIAVMQGASAINADHLYVNAPNYVYSFDLTEWGWVHVVIGALVALTGVGVLLGNTVARWTGVVVVGAGLLAQFMWLPYYPVWAIIAIAIDIFVLWALCYRPRTEADRRTV